MCGISGYFYLDGGGPRHEEALGRMAEALRHRGPDENGTFIDDNVGLAIRRLSVIDLDTGSQPMANEDGAVRIVYNGELYNTPELRADLESKGHSFRTRSDTEVIVHLYEEMGERCVERLNGMFAFAIYDAKARSLVLARDRLGIKPLYVARVGRALVWASELKSLVRFPGFVKRLDREALVQYLALEFVPAPLSIYEGVEKLEAATTLLARGGKLTRRTYWRLGYEPKHEPVSEREAAGQLEELLRDAVVRRLVSDVPLGIFLSGGVDSGTVAALATAGGRPIKTFSIGFDEPSFDETRYSELAAAHLASEHHHMVVTARDLLDVVPDICNILDEPMADASVVPTFLLSRFTRGEVTVALAGDGGDELFAGYPHYQAHRLAPIYRRVPRFLRRPIAGAAGLLPVDKRNFSLDFVAKRFVAGADRDGAERNSIWMGSFAPDDLGRLLADSLLETDVASVALAPARRHDGECDARDPVERMQYLDTRLYLAEDILVKTDRSSMACSLEVRVPFLDHRVVEFVARLPARMKLRGLRGKHLLKRVARRLLPARIVERRKKGFGIPVARWVDGPLREFAHDTLASRALADLDVVRPERVRAILEEHHAGRYDHRKQIWTLLVLALWAENCMGPSSAADGCS